MSEKIVKVNLNPLKKFNYNQMYNHNFCYLLLDQKLKAMHTPFMCKDYLNDILYCENTGRGASIWGLNWTKGIFDLSPEYYYLAMMGGGFKMESIYKELEELLNQFDKAQGFKLSEVMRTDNPEIVVIKFSKEWAENAPLISAFTSVIRLSGAYKLGQDVIEYLKMLLNKRMGKNGFPIWMSPDLARLDRTIRRLAALLAGKKVQHNWKDFSNIHECHDTGILNYKNFPEVEI